MLATSNCAGAGPGPHGRGRFGTARRAGIDFHRRCGNAGGVNGRHDLRVEVVSARGGAGGDSSGSFAVGGHGANAGIIQAVHLHSRGGRYVGRLANVRINIAGHVIQRNRAAQPQRSRPCPANDNRRDVINEGIVEVTAFRRGVGQTVVVVIVALAKMSIVSPLTVALSTCAKTLLAIRFLPWAAAAASVPGVPHQRRKAT